MLYVKFVIYTEQFENFEKQGNVNKVVVVSFVK